MTLAPYAAALAACPGGLRVRASFSQAVIPTVSGPYRIAQPLGVLRLRAPGPCRRRPGPAFVRPSIGVP